MPSFDRQAIFDTAVSGILKQGRLAANEDGGCYYRLDPTIDPDTENNYAEAPLRCGVGHCIPDDKYELRFENQGPLHPDDVSYISEDNKAGLRISEVIGATTQEDVNFLRKLQQNVHDSAASLISVSDDERMERFREYALEFAVVHSLDAKVLTT